MTTCIRLDSLPEAIRAEALRHGRPLGPRIEIEVATLNRLLNRAPSEEKMRGLGDLVARLAQPIARAIDAVAGTNLKNCGGCHRRRDKLNKAVPFNRQN